MCDSYESPSIVEYFGEHSNSRCGYCCSSDTNCSNGMWAHTLRVQDYQDLIDRGWRRSGKYCYKPVMEKTCCPSYAIRCHVADFQPSCSQRKVMRRAATYLRIGERPPGQHSGRGGYGDMEEPPPVPPQCQPQEAELVKVGVARPIGDTVQILSVTPTDKLQSSRKKMPRPGDGADVNKPRCQKSKLLRLEKWRKKQALKSADTQASCENKLQNSAKSIEDFLNEVMDNPAHHLEISLVRSHPRSEGFDATFDESYAVYRKYQMRVHNDPADKPTRKQFSRFLVDSPLQIKLVRSKPESGEFRASQAESHSVFRAYQMAVHNDTDDDCDEESFRRFLVESPLQPLYKSDGLPDGYGSFHQQYILDGKIIAVGVIDILPTCISSVYLYYDPDYFFLSPGTYSALREIAFTRYLHSVDANIEHYYMGYYIHSCPKMKYKGNFQPSSLLCPETYTWHALAGCAAKLDAAAYSRFADPGARDTHRAGSVKMVMTLHVGQQMPYYVYQHMKPAEAKKEDALVKQYNQMVGSKCASSLLLYRA